MKAESVLCHFLDWSIGIALSTEKTKSMQEVAPIGLDRVSVTEKRVIKWVCERGSGPEGLKIARHEKETDRFKSSSEIY